MISRRDLLKLTSAAGGALSINPGILQALARQELITRAIPSSGEELPIVGLGSSATFSRVARTEDFSALREALAEIMKTEPLDFIGIDYAVDNRSAEEMILPLAKEEGIGVLVYVPFGRSRLFSRVGDREVPDWARPFAESWAQFFYRDQGGTTPFIRA